MKHSMSLMCGQNFLTRMKKRSFPSIRSYIGLGSNLGHPETQLRRAVMALSKIPNSVLITVSPFYHTAPMGPQDQPDFVNAVVALDTYLPPEGLLCALQRIEQVQDRVRQKGVHWGPRTLDLDLLLYGALQCDTGFLQLPHPGLQQRDFVV